MTNKTVAERLREAVKQRRRCNADFAGNALGRAVICDSEKPCFECEAEWFNALADAIEAEQADLREKSEFERDASRKERKCLCKRIEELERKVSEYKRMLDFRKELKDKNGIVLKGLRDLANTSKYHTNTEWKRIVMRLTENAEDYANRVIAEAMAQAKEKQNGVDVDALLKLADEIDLKANKIVEMGNSVAKAHGKDVNCVVTYPRATMEEWSNAIRAAVECANASKPQLPEGVIWPRFEDGELVRFGDEFVAGEKENTYEVVCVKFHSNGEFSLVAPNGTPNCFYSPRFCNGTPVKRPEPEVLDADGVTIKVGDTVYRIGENPLSGERTVKSIEAEPGHIRKVFFKENGCWANPRDLTHRKPDTFKSVVEEMLTDFDSHDTIELDGYFDRLRKLMGGE